MRYANAAAFRTALEQRLSTVSRETGLSVTRLRKTVVFDRLLARLFESAPERWILKGGSALDFRFHSAGRATKDIDLVRHDNEEAVTEDLVTAQALDLNDYFHFAIEKVESRNQEVLGGALRYRARAELGGREFDSILVDVGFSDPLGWNPEKLVGPELLAFADIEPAAVFAIQLEQHVAEKLHAYTRTYGERFQSSRAKDLIDIVLIKSYATLHGNRLSEALRKTFDSRGMQELPSSVPAPPTEWAIPYKTMAQEVGINPSLDEAHQEAQTLLNPILQNRKGIQWNPGTQKWEDSV